MKSCTCIAIATGFALASPLPVHAATASAFQLEDLRKIVSLSEPQISPDGKRIAVIVSTPNWKTDKSKQELDLVDVATGARRALTLNRSDLSSPRWSPDGMRLAFIARDSGGDADPDANNDADDDSAEKQDQVYIMPMHGGDAMRVTSTAHGIEAFSWSPDGKQIAFVAADDPVNQKAIKAHDDAFQVTDNNFLMRAALTPCHLWVVSSEGGKAKRLTSGAYSLQTDQQDATPVPTWSADGRSIAFTRFPNPYWGPSFHSVIAAVDANGGEPRALVSAEGAINVRYADDSANLAFMRPRDGDQNNGNAVYVQVDGAIRDITKDHPL